MKKAKKESLTSSQFNVIINLNSLDEKLSAMLKEKELKEIIDLTRIKERERRVYIYVDRKQYSAANYNSLIDVLYEEFANPAKKETLTSLFDKYFEIISTENTVTPKTRKLYLSDFNKFFKGSYLATTPISQLRAKDFKKHYESMTKDELLTKKAFTNAKVIINKLMAFAVEEEIISSSSIATDIDLSNLKFKSDVPKVEAFSEEEIAMIFEEAINMNTPYSLAIALMTLIPSRVSDIRGLRWDAIDFRRRFIYYRAMVVDSPIQLDDLSFKGYDTENKQHGKKNTKEANSRKFPITPAIELVLEKAKALNSSGEYVFMYNGNPLNLGTINRNLQRICKKLGLEKVSAHHLRFSNATNLHDSGLTIKRVGKMLGHTNTNTTCRYLISSKEDDDAIREAMNKIHNHVCNKAWYIKEKEDGNYDT